MARWKPLTSRNVAPVEIDGMLLQVGADVREFPVTDWPKFVCGAELRYLGPSDDNLPLFAPGQFLTVAADSRGDGISAICEGMRDMVWPWEVVVVGGRRPCVDPVRACARRKLRRLRYQTARACGLAAIDSVRSANVG